MNKVRLRRLPGWEDRLDALLREAADGFRGWGVRDCALFAADAVEALTGHDPAAEFRGRYSTPLGAARALSRYGAGDLIATADAVLPRHDRPVLACRGDIVAVPFADGGALALAVVELNGTAWVALGPDAILTGPLDAARIAWRVG